MNKPSMTLPDDCDPWLTEQEAARRLRVSVSTVRNERRRRRLGFARVGKRVLIPLSALEAYKAAMSFTPCLTTSSPDLSGLHDGTSRGRTDDVRDVLRRARKIARKHSAS